MPLEEIRCGASRQEMSQYGPGVLAVWDGGMAPVIFELYTLYFDHFCSYPEGSPVISKKTSQSDRSIDYNNRMRGWADGRPEGWAFFSFRVVKTRYLDDL